MARHHSLVVVGAEKPTEPTCLYGIENVLLEVEATIGTTEVVSITKATDQLGGFTTDKAR